MDPKINKADEDLEKIRNRKKRDNDGRKVANEIFDDTTLQNLYKLANKNYLTILNGEISTGKEANVLKGIKEDNTPIAVKIYRIATSDFKKMQYYIQGDPRFHIKSTNKRRLITSWVNKEYRNLQRLYDNNVNVPKPITTLNNILLMEFIGNKNTPAPTTQKQKPKDSEQFFQKLLTELDKFINQANLIHGDLSTFNILNHNERPVIIDVSQSVVKDHQIAKELLERDIENINKILFSNFDADVFEKTSKDSDIVVLCNINFSRHLIPKAKEMGLTIASDVHCLSDINDGYNSDFIKAADILFLSNESFTDREEDFIRSLKTVTDAEIIVTGMGNKGALLYLRSSDSFEVFPAVYTRQVVNTIGAGDSLFASFLHFYAKTKDPRYSLRLATVFASYKIGDTSACRGFLDEESLIKLNEEIGG